MPDMPDAIVAQPERHDDLYAAMRESEMNAWVGGADPELVGYSSDVMMRRLLPMGPEPRVLDFGAGIGRVSAALLRRPDRPVQLVGFDIVPQLVDFCRREIEPRFPGATFELVAGANDHYDRFIDGLMAPSSRDDLLAKYSGHFTHAYATSVFTHLDPKQFQRELGFVRQFLSIGGDFLFTAFTLTPFSRRMIERDALSFASPNGEYRDDGQIFVGSIDDPLAFIAYDRSLIEAYVDQAGLVVTKVEYGTWSGGDIGQDLQDMYVCRRVD